STAAEAARRMRMPEACWTGANRIARHIGFGAPSLDSRKGYIITFARHVHFSSLARRRAARTRDRLALDPAALRVGAPRGGRRADRAHVGRRLLGHRVNDSTLQQRAGTDAALRFSNLTLGYERHPAVHHLDGEIEKGSLLAVV